ncbi:MAG: peptide chain release factor N(5)-glutamine methyltransferase [Bacteroidota bacterium]|nr:peptide chain release factor N(5)-glutamine methyltransferase [Bacteroidota bacterium]
MILLEEFRVNFIKELEPLYDDREARNILKLTVKSFFGWDSTFFAMNKFKLLSENEYKKVNEALRILKKGKPVQYLLNESEFMGNLFYVNEFVLIPRPETEEVINWILTENFPTKLKPLRVLDIGTGSGCIAISIAKSSPYFQVDAIDFSSNALSVAKKNAKLMGVEINFKKLDILKLDKLDKEYDVIVSNPPYIDLDDKKTMSKNVLDYEPLGAIFVPYDDPLFYYKEIILFAEQMKENRGTIYFEINPKYSNNLKKYFLTTSFNDVVVQCDIFGKERMLKATHK